MIDPSRPCAICLLALLFAKYSPLWETQKTILSFPLTIARSTQRTTDCDATIVGRHRFYRGYLPLIDSLGPRVNGREMRIHK